MGPFFDGGEVPLLRPWEGDLPAQRRLIFSDPHTAACSLHSGPSGFREPLVLPEWHIRSLSLTVFSDWRARGKEKGKKGARPGSREEERQFHGGPGDHLKAPHIDGPQF